MKMMHKYGINISSEITLMYCSLYKSRLNLCDYLQCPYWARRAVTLISTAGESKLTSRDLENEKPTCRLIEWHQLHIIITSVGRQGHFLASGHWSDSLRNRSLSFMKTTCCFSLSDLLIFFGLISWGTCTIDLYKGNKLAFTVQVV